MRGFSVPSCIVEFKNKLFHGSKIYNEPGILAVDYVALTVVMARSTPADSILRGTSLFRIHITTMKGLNTYVTPWEPSEWIKTSVVGTILVNFWVILRLCWGRFRCKWAWYWTFSSFQGPRILYWCFRRDMEWSSSYQKASGAAKHSKSLAIAGCRKLLGNGYLRPDYGQVLT